MMDAIIAVLSKNALVTALAVTGLMMFVSHLLSKYLTKENYKALQSRLL